MLSMPPDPNTDLLVYAESPSTPAGLWKQRVRWSRGLLQSVRLHSDMIGNPRYGPFGVYLMVNFVSQMQLGTEFVQRLRPMAAFPDVEALLGAMAKDVTDTRALLGMPPTS